MRKVLLLSFLVSVLGLVVVACGDDPGGSDLPYAYAIDATPDGILQAYEEAGAAP